MDFRLPTVQCSGFNQEFVNSKKLKDFNRGITVTHVNTLFTISLQLTVINSREWLIYFFHVLNLQFSRVSDTEL